jgi:DNA end-binding protein Ku
VKPYSVASSEASRIWWSWRSHQDRRLAGEGYAVIRDALRKTGKVGLAQLTVSGREWLVAIAPLQDGIVMELLRYADELREPAEYFDEVPTAKPQKDMVDLAVQCRHRG